MPETHIAKVILSLILTILAMTDFCRATEFSLGDLGEVVVRADDVVVYGEKKPANAVIAAKVITAKELETKGVQTLAEALEYAVGVDIQPGGKGESHVNMRGFDQTESKVLIDGVPAYEGYFGIVDLTAVPTQAIEKIVIEKGASSVLYGPNTMGGVVNIITRKGALVSGRETEVYLAGGDYNSRNYGLSHTAHLGRINYYAGYGRRSSDGFATSGSFDNTDRWIGENSEYHENGGLRELSDYDKQSLIANIGYDTNNNTRANLSISYFNNKHGCPVESNRYWTFSRWRQWQLSLTGEHKFSSAAVLNSRVFYVDHGDEITDDTGRTALAGGQVWFDKSRYDDFSVGGEISFRLMPNKRNLFRLGLNYQKDRNNQREYNARNFYGDILAGWGVIRTYEADTYSIGGEDLLELTDKLCIIVGAGYSHFAPLKSADMPSPGDISTLNPQAGISYDITDKATLVSSIGKKTRFPRMVELYSKHAGGNPDLLAEKTIAADIGLEYSLNDFTDISISWFHNDVSNLIERIRDESGLWIYQNVGRALFYGWEMQIKSIIIDRINTEANYTYLHTKIKTANSEPANRPRHKLNFGLGYDMHANISLNVFGSYVGRQVQYYDENDETIPGIIPDYFLGNARIAYRITTDRLASTELFITVNNLFDINYEEGDGPMPGRSFLAGFNVKI